MPLLGFAGATARLRIDIPAIPDVQDYDLPLGVVDFVDDAIITRADALAVAPDQFLAARRPRVIRQCRDGVTYTRVISFGQIGQLLLSAPQDEHLVAHLDAPSISFTAWEKGTASSPDALASS